MPFFSKTARRIIFATFASLLILIVLNRCSLMGGGGAEGIRADDYELNAPKEWRASKNKEADRAFELPSGSRVAVTSSCRRWVKAPLTVMAKQLLIGNHNLRILAQEPLPITGGEGLVTRAKAKENGAELFLTVVLVRKQECLFDVIHIGKNEITQEEQRQLIQMAKGLHYGTDETIIGAH